MKVSIITATYNSGKTLKTCMSSVLNQDYTDVEYVIIDGASADETSTIVDSFSKDFSNIKYISEPDKGIYDALNKGIEYASGDVVGLVHSDDLLASNTIVSEIVDAFKEDVDGVYGDLIYVQKENTENIVRFWKSQKFRPKLLKQGWMPAHPTLFLRKNIYESHGSFNLGYRIAADYDFILRIFQNENLNFQYLPKVITKMRVGGASNRSIKNIFQKSQEDYKALKANGVGGFFTLMVKNVSKLSQFVLKKNL